MSSSILVVGAGVAGLALSRALALRGLECTVVDQRPCAPGLGMGLNLPGNAIRALADLGVVDRALRRGKPVRRREYRNGRGRLLFAVEDAEFWRGVGSPVCMRHGHLLEALRTANSDTVRYGARALSARPVAQQVEVQMAGEETTRNYDLVVGADGVRSAMRSAVAEADVVRASAMTRSSWRLIGDNPGVECWTAWSGADATFLLIPVENGLVYGYAASTRGGTTGTDPSWLAGAFAGFPDPVTEVIAGVLSGAGELHHAPVDEVRQRCWHRGRLVLIGDAAHATGPVWAQGAAMALEDALVLADVLSRHRDWSNVGATFEHLRRSRVDHVQAATDNMSRLARLPIWLRDLAAPTFGPRAYRDAYEPLRSHPLSRKGGTR